MVYGTGTNYFGQLTGPEDSKSALTPLVGLPPGVLVTAVAAGFGTCLVLGDDGLVYGAGSNSPGSSPALATGAGPSPC